VDAANADSGIAYNVNADYCVEEDDDDDDDDKFGNTIMVVVVTIMMMPMEDFAIVITHYK
jgi:hypothetical protein